MRIRITVKTNAKREGVEKVEEAQYRVSVKAPPAEGRANEAVVRVLADYFDVPKSRVEIVRGNSSKQKVIEIS